MSKNIEFNHINTQVFQLIEDLDVAGNVTKPRGFQCKGANLATLDIDPLFPIMDFEVRPFNYKYFAGELAWYFKASPNIDFINNFSSFWKNICDDNKANSNYGNLMFNGAGGIDGHGVNQLEWVYESLVIDKDTRQAIAFYNQPMFQYKGNKDFVCTMYMNFFINKDHLDMKVQMRSNDIFFGLTYDAGWFALIHQNMYMCLKKIYPELKLGMYYHCADNIHYYERHFDIVQKILDSQLRDSIKMELKKPLFDFNENGLFLTDETLNYIEKIDNILQSNDISNSQSYWKYQLSDLFIFS
jgi:thymidylate synthase